jgi:Fis family transcriptional regulator, factor for inversion stimulation protein
MDILEQHQTQQAQQATSTKTLRESVSEALKKHFEDTPKDQLSNVYDLILAEIEEPLLRTVLERCRGNQSKAAIILGLSRGTLRKKLKAYGLI